MPDVASLQIRVETIGVDTAKAKLKGLESAGSSVVNSNKKLARSTDGVTASLRKLGTATAAYTSYKIVKSIVHTGLEFDRMERALLAATGSMSSAKREMAFLREETDRIGVSILATGKGYAQLSAAAKGTAISQGQIREIFSAVSEASVVLGLSADDTKGAIRALVQVMSKGKVQAEELRGQLGERFPGAFQAAARSMKMNTEELSKMLEMGNVLADEFIPKFAREIRRTYAEALPEAMESAQASFARFHNAMAYAEDEIAQGGLLHALSTLSIYGADFLNTTIAQVKTTAKWAAAYSVGQVSFWEWLTTGADEAAVKIHALEAQMDDMAGKHIKIVRPEEKDKKPKKSRSEIAEEKRALARSQKAFARLQADLQSEEEVIESSYAARTKLIEANTAKDSDLRSTIMAKSKARYDEELKDFNNGKETEYNSLRDAMATQEEAIKESYDRRKAIIDAASFASPGEKDESYKRIAADRDKQLKDLQDNKLAEYHTIQDGLRSEEEEILASYNKRREIILANTQASEEEKAELINRLNEEFATDAIGKLGKNDTYNEQIKAVEDYYTRRHDLVMENVALTEEDRTAIEMELTQQRNDQLAALEKARMYSIMQGTEDTFSGLADMAAIFKGKQSKEYKVMFAASKAFQIAQAIMKTYDAATGAYSAMSSIPYVGPALGAAAAAAAVGAGMANVAMIRSQTYSGAYDSGGIIPGGSVGLVGEVGPEIVSGPANVMSRKDTAALLGKEQAPPPPPVNNIRIVNAFDPAVVGDYIGSDAGEQAVLNVVKRNASTIKQMTG